MWSLVARMARQGGAITCSQQQTLRCRQVSGWRSRRTFRAIMGSLRLCSAIWRERKGGFSSWRRGRRLVLALADSQEDVGAADGVEAVEGCGVGAIGEMVGPGWNSGPGALQEVGGKLRDQEPRCVGAGGCHDDVGAHANGENGIWRRRRAWRHAEMDLTVKAMNGT